MNESRVRGDGEHLCMSGVIMSGWLGERWRSVREINGEAALAGRTIAPSFELLRPRAGRTSSYYSMPMNANHSIDLHWWEKERAVKLELECLKLPRHLFGPLRPALGAHQRCLIRSSQPTSSNLRHPTTDNTRPRRLCAYEPLPGAPP